MSGRPLHAAISPSSLPHRADTRLLEKDVPHRASVISATLRVDTPSTYISIRAKTSAFSLRW